MPEYNFIQLDVFTDRAFTGNPLAVFPEAEGITDEQMQQIAREMNLSETVFVLPSDKEGVTRRLRIFTPNSELPFAWSQFLKTATVASICNMKSASACCRSKLILKIVSR
jgi:trans-2,3-dihydro-3-hydroxyanthranilate isomerase